MMVFVYSYYKKDVQLLSTLQTMRLLGNLLALVAAVHIVAGLVLNRKLSTINNENVLDTFGIILPLIYYLG